KIPDVGNSKVKKDLEKRIETIVNELAANDSYEEANNKVTAIEGILQSKLVISLPKLVDGTDGPIESHSKFDDYIETLESDIKVANDLIKSVKDKTKSTALKNRMAAITNAKDTAKLIVTAEKSHPSYVKKEITAAEKAVAKVADNVIYKDIKDNFLARIN